MTGVSDNSPGGALAGATRGERPRLTGGQVYLLGLLMVINMFNMLDRYVINIVAEPIKRELALSDAQIGIMTGIGFALTYAIAGVAVARLADRMSRPWLIAGSVTIWSAFTGLSSAAQSFAQLLICRFGVAFGEAGCTPAAHALIVDSVPRESRASAIAIYSIGAPLGLLLGMGVGGLVAQAYGWRMAFVVAAVPGVVLALLAALTIREPRVRSSRIPADRVSLKEALGMVRVKRTYWFACAGYGCVLMVSFGLSAFSAPYFLRNHEAEIGVLAAAIGSHFGVAMKPLGFLGIALGLTYGLSGAFGTWLGGYVSDALGRVDMRRALWPNIVGNLLATGFFVAGFTADSVVVALILLTIGQIALASSAAPFFATIQGITPAPIRATSAAIALLVINLMGSMGPLVVGMASDLASVRQGEGGGVRTGLYCVIAMSAMAAWLFYLSSRTVTRDAEF